MMDLLCIFFGRSDARFLLDSMVDQVSGICFYGVSQLEEVFCGEGIKREVVMYFTTSHMRNFEGRKMYSLVLRGECWRLR